jgi:hypothetical protein
MEQWRNENWQGKPEYLEKSCPSATLSIADLTFSMGNLLSYGTAFRKY